jgi:multiple sugar transport system substrate-binding protein
MALNGALLTSCSNGADKSGTTLNQEQSSPNKPEEPVELVFYSHAGESEDSFNGRYGDVIRAKFPDYAIKYIRKEKGATIPELIAANQRVDIIYNVFDYVLEPLVDSKLQYDMTDLAKKHGVDLNKFEPTVMEGIRKAGNGKLYMLPASMQVSMLFYNKELFNKFGVPYPKDGMTWNELKGLSQKMTRKEGDQQYYGFVGFPQFALKTNPFSEPYLDPNTGKSTFEKETWKKVIQDTFLDHDFDNALRTRIIEKNALPYRLEFTNTKEIAMFHFHSEFPNAVPKDMEKIDWDMVAFPTYKELNGVGSQATAVSMSITSIAKNKDAAMEVIKYITSVENQTAYSKKGVLSVLKDESVKAAFGLDSPFKDKNWKAVFYNKLAPMPYRSEYELLVENIYIATIKEIVKGQKDMNTIMREAAEAADKAVAEAKSVQGK